MPDEDTHVVNSDSVDQTEDDKPAVAVEVGHTFYEAVFIFSNSFIGYHRRRQA